MHFTSLEWIGKYKEKDALWIHDGNPRRPHALLTSGKHSSGFFNSRLVIPDEALLSLAASDLAESLVLRGIDIAQIECVVGPQTGATKLSELIAREIMTRTKTPCSFASPAKHTADGVKSMVFSNADLPLMQDRRVLLCEDVLSTGGSVDLAAAAVTRAGGTILPFVLVLVNRSGLSEGGGRKILSLIERSMPMWIPDECPLCMQGSQAIPPKGENWALLNAVY